MHCSACGFDNRSGVRFCEDCGTGLDQACPRCGATGPAARKFCGECGGPVGQTVVEDPASRPHRPAEPTAPPAPSSYTPRELAARILSSRGAIEGERKQVTVLFADIEGSTALIERLDPEDAVGLLQPTVQAMMDAVHRFEGTVNRVQGDGIMALFGAPIAHEDHALRACEAALAMQAALAQQEGLPVRIGLNTGEVIVRSIDNDLTVEYEADGPTVHLAARMERMARAGQVAMTTATLALVRDMVEATSLGLQDVKGMPEPVEVWALESVRRAHSRWALRAGQRLSPFVGRESELASLERALRRAREHRGQIVGIVGETGVGKSRLVHEFTRFAASVGWTVRVAGGDPLDTTTSYKPVTSLLRALFEIGDHDSKEAAASKVRDALAALDSKLEDHLPALLEVLDLPVDDAHWDALDPGERRDAIITAIRTLTQCRAERVCLLLVFEDLHWFDAETLAALESLVDSLAGARLMVLVSARPEWPDTWSAKSYYTRLRLDPLEPVTADEFLDNSLGLDPALEPLKRLLFERTQGLPFFLEECLRALLEAGHLEGAPGAYRLVGSVATLDVPPTVQAVLAARIDRLPASHKDVLQAAAVIGRNVALSMLRAIAGIDDDALDSVLADLQAAELVYLSSPLPEPEYTFKHALTRDVAYSSLLMTRRREMHKRLVHAIETRHGGRIEEHLAVLGHHAMCADLWEKAADCLQRAGARALERSAYREAIELFEQTLTALAKRADSSTDIDRVFDIHLALRTAHGASGNVDRMAQHLREAHELATQAADHRKAALVQCLCTSVLGLHENLDAAIVTIEQASAVARRDGDAELLHLTTVSVSILLALRGRYADAAAIVEHESESMEGTARHERYGITATWSVLLTGTGAMHETQIGNHARAMQWARESVNIARETARPFDVAIALVMQGTAALWRGDLAHAIPALTGAHDICMARSIGILQPNVIPALAYAHALDGRVCDAARLVGPWLPTAKLRGPPFWLHGWGFAFAGLAGAAVGDAQAALTYLEGPLELVQAHAMPGLEPALLRARAACRRAVGDGRAAGADLRRALELARSHAMAVEQAQCNLALGQLLLDEGESDEGRALLESARTAMLTMDMPFWAGLAQEAPQVRLPG